LRRTFEQATEKDAGAIVALERKIGDLKTYGQPLGLEAALEEIRKNTFYLIKDGDIIVGTAAYRVRPDNSVYISHMAIDPGYRRLGLARAAMSFLLERNKGASRIDLVTHPENEIALRLYRSFGFQVEARKENYFGDGEPRLVLAKETL
jgi:ribosomal protein S18 acetylase RimI-like enzyme